MASYISNLKTWGSQGNEYPDSYNYVEGEQPVDAWDNYLTYNIIEDIDHLVSLTNDRIESGSGTSHPSDPEPGELSYRTDSPDGSGKEELYQYDGTNATWERVLKASGDTMSGVLDMGGYQITDSTGAVAIDGIRGPKNTLDVEVGLSHGVRFDYTSYGPKIIALDDGSPADSFEYDNRNGMWNFNNQIMARNGVVIEGNLAYHRGNIGEAIQSFSKYEERIPSSGTTTTSTFNSFGGMAPHRIYLSSDSSGAEVTVALHLDDGSTESYTANNSQETIMHFPNVDGQTVEEVTFQFDNQSGSTASMRCECDGVAHR